MNKKQLLLNKLIKKVGSQTKLAESLGISQCTLSNLIHEDKRLISHKLSHKITKIYKVPVMTIFKANLELKKTIK